MAGNRLEDSYLLYRVCLGLGTGRPMKG